MSVKLPDSAEDLRAELARLAKAEEEARKLAAGAEARLSVVVAEVREREAKMVAEVRERETKMVQEVREREAQLVSSAQAREAQLLAAGQAREAQLLAAAQEREAQLSQDLKDASGQIFALTHLTSVVESARSDLRKLRAEMEEMKEREGRGDARAAELQAVVDSLGRERAALRSEAGAMRAKVEALVAADERARRLAQELEDLRGENEFLNQELERSRSASPRVISPPPLPKTPGA